MDSKQKLAKPCKLSNYHEEDDEEDEKVRANHLNTILKNNGWNTFKGFL